MNATKGRSEAVSEIDASGVMASAAAANLPVDEGRIREAIAQQIQKFGLDKLTSRIIREKLKETFNADFSAYKAAVDKITMEVVQSGEHEKEDEGAAKEAAETKSDESTSDSDDADTDRSSRRKTRASKKAAKDTRKPKSEEDSEVLESGQRKRRSEASKKASPKRSRGSGSNGKQPRRKNSYTVYCALSNDLAAVCGARYMRRCDVIKTMWAYFKSNNLLDPKDRRYVLPDEPLMKIFKSKRFLAFGIMKDLISHIIEPRFLNDVERAALEKYQAEEEARREAESKADAEDTEHAQDADGAEGEDTEEGKDEGDKSA